MADDILQVCHKKFIYVYISSDINDPVKEITFEGSEEEFQKRLNAHFRRIILGEQEKAEFRDILKEKIGEQGHRKKDIEQNNKVEEIETEEEKEKKNDDNKNKEETKKDSKENTLLSSDTLNMFIDSASSYQIVPLTLPTKENNFFAINCYIDDVGKLKNLPYNSRASRICNTDIHGDAFISKTYDNEDFKRIDFNIEEYEQFLKNPPKSLNRFSLGGNVKTLMKAANAQSSGELQSQKQKPITCSNCFKEGNLKKCGKCKKVYYCSVDCQKKDFIFHRRICL